MGGQKKSGGQKNSILSIPITSRAPSSVWQSTFIAIKSLRAQSARDFFCNNSKKEQNWEDRFSRGSRGGQVSRLTRGGAARGSVLTPSPESTTVSVDIPTGTCSFSSSMKIFFILKMNCHSVNLWFETTVYIYTMFIKKNINFKFRLLHIIMRNKTGRETTPPPIKYGANFGLLKRCAKRVENVFP